MGAKRSEFERGFLAQLPTKPPKRGKNIVVRLTDAEHEALVKDAARYSVSISAYVRTAIRLVLPGG